MLQLSRLRHQPSLLPQTPGVYLFKDRRGHTLYIGKAKNLRARVNSYFLSSDLGPRTQLMLGKAGQLDYIKVESDLEALLLEASLINKFQPPYNVISIDYKSPLYIVITKEKYPRMRTARLRDLKYPTSHFFTLKNLSREFLGTPPSSASFGPFPTGTSVKLLLRRLRRIFPYCETKTDQGRPCLHSHIGLCNPCPRQLVAHPDPAKAYQYRRNISHLKRVLSGKPKQVISLLVRQMNQAVARQDYETAAILRDQIKKLQILSQSPRNIDEYLTNPNLLDDQASQALDALAKTLNLVSTPQRIECYDISHTGRSQATAAMVVATDGILDPSNYRHFKIKFSSVPNDVAAVSETITRRLTHPEWGIPDLIIIDGGKPQLRAASAALQTPNHKSQITNLSVIALAKRLEEIYLSDRLQPLRLPESDSAMRLIIRLRNEAHRFARRLHHKLRSKALFG